MCLSFLGWFRGVCPEVSHPRSVASELLRADVVVLHTCGVQRGLHSAAAGERALLLHWDHDGDGAVRTPRPPAAGSRRRVPGDAATAPGQRGRPPIGDRGAMRPAGAPSLWPSSRSSPPAAPATSTLRASSRACILATQADKPYAPPGETVNMQMWRSMDARTVTPVERLLAPQIWEDPLIVHYYTCCPAFAIHCGRHGLDSFTSQSTGETHRGP